MPKVSKIKLKYLADIFNGNSIPDDKKSEFEGKTIPYILTKELSVEDGSINYENGLSVNEEDNFKIAPSESVLMCIEGGSAGKKIGLTDRRVAFVNKLCCIHGTTVSSKYLYHALRSKDFTDQFYLNMTGLIGGVSTNALKNISISLPDGEGQQSIITHYLDQKCEQVDTLIANVQAQIEKLKAYKQSLITEVVLNGLDPIMPMKDSGVEWMGIIPAHWGVKCGKHLFAESDLRSADGSEELLTVSQYTGITPRSQKNVNMFEALSLEGYKICKVGDIAANTMWMWAGAIGVSQYYGVVSPSYNVYHQIGNAYLSKYLDYLLRIPPLVQCYESQSTGIRASRLRLYPQQFLNIRFPVPPYAEQEAVVAELEGRCEKVDRLIAIKQRKIDKLNEYKKSLIYECVTGKKEVPVG